MALRGWAQSAEAAAARRSRGPAPSANANEVTDVIPFNEFGSLTDSHFSDHSAFDDETVLLRAPELDDLHDTDNLIALPLALPQEFAATPRARRGRPSRDNDTPGRRGQHRKPATSPARGRILIAAMAAGAASAAVHTGINPPRAASASTEPASSASPPSGGAEAAATHGIQMVTVKPAASTVVHDEELAKGMAFAQERAEREARLQAPLFVTPTQGILTSNFGYRWGSLHGGVDLANSIGTPILAVSDGVVIEAGPSAGYGQLVKLRHHDGTATLYGHVDTTSVGVGERVMAGDQIATMGNRGDSTGPHLHLEVLLNGSGRIDPIPWLANRGVHLG